MTLMLVMLTAMTAWADGVDYIDANGVVRNTATDDIVGNDNPTVLTGGGETRLSAGWYVVNSDITYTGDALSGLVILDGDVTIILANGKTMNIGKSENEPVTGSGIRGLGHSLTIYGQTLDEGTAGQLRIYTFYTSIGTAGILSSTYTQHSGNVTINSFGNNAIYASDITINGGKLDATASTLWQWASSSDVIALAGSNITMNGGIVNATGIQEYSGNSADGIYCTTTLTLGWRNASDRFTASSFGGPNTVTIADGKAFTTDGTDIYTGTLSSDEKAAIAGKTLQPLTAVSLADAADNATAIGKLNGVEDIDITLQGRTLWKDGAWNTLCLPFDVTIAGSILDGADVRALDNANLTDNVLTLNFTYEGTVTEIEAGTPYIIKWASGANITDPEFTGVTVRSGMNDFESTDDKVTFKGTYDYMSWTEETPSILFVGANDKLHWPEEGASLGACRAYFELSDVEPGGGGGNAPELRIVLNFGEEEKTGISSLTPDPSPKGKGSDYYTLDGRKLNAKHMKKGLYIHNGRKVVIK